MQRASGTHVVAFLMFLKESNFCLYFSINITGLFLFCSQFFYGSCWINIFSKTWNAIVVPKYIFHYNSEKNQFVHDVRILAFIVKYYVSFKQDSWAIDCMHYVHEQTGIFLIVHIQKYYRTALRILSPL